MKGIKMKRRLLGLVAVVSGFLMSGLAMAQDAAHAGSDSSLWAIGSALAIGLATLGGTMGQGKAAEAALSGIARNPSSADKVFMPMIIALALIEFQAIMGFIIAFLWYSK